MGRDHLTRGLSGRCCFDSLGEKLINHRWSLRIVGTGTEYRAERESGDPGDYTPQYGFSDVGFIARLAWRKKG
jgi:hypothetical protein